MTTTRIVSARSMFRHQKHKSREVETDWLSLESISYQNNVSYTWLKRSMTVAHSEQDNK